MFMGIMNDEPRLTATITDRFFLKNTFFPTEAGNNRFENHFFTKKGYKKRVFF